MSFLEPSGGIDGHLLHQFHTLGLEQKGETAVLLCPWNIDKHDLPAFRTLHTWNRTMEMTFHVKEIHVLPGPFAFVIAFA